jgi:hypothetical protein
MTQRSGGGSRERVDEARRPRAALRTSAAGNVETLPTAFTRMIPTSDVDRLSVRTTNR